MGLWDLKKVIGEMAAMREVSPRDLYNDAIWIWEEGLGYDAGQQKVIDPEEERKLMEMIYRISEGEPVQYVIGHGWFYGLKLKVSPHVLIPRPETEELVEWVLSDIKGKSGPLRILDIGTGSGCIAIALKHHLRSHAEIVALDISSDALVLAKENAAMTGVDVDFIRRDFLQKGIEGLGEWDVIVSNPPYISRDDQYALQDKSLVYEPGLALFPPVHADQFYEKMSEILPAHLCNKGSGYFEMNEFRADVIKEYFENGLWSEIEIRQDMQGKPRILKVVKK